MKKFFSATPSILFANCLVPTSNVSFTGCNYQK